MQDIQGKTAFVTGGASGIGLGIAQALAEAGMRVMIADFRRDHIADAMALFDTLQLSDRVDAVELDVTDRGGFARAADTTIERFGAVHVLVNNAGVGVLGPVVDATLADWDYGVQINLGGAINGLCTFLPRMVAQGQGGHVVNVSSLSGLTPAPRNAAIYATTKFALVGMSEGIREELSDHGIGVTVILPGPFKTNIRDAGLNRPERFQAASGLKAFETQMAARVDGGAWAEPLDAGIMVRDAILENRFYVVTHGEYRGWAEGKFEEILAAYPYADPDVIAANGRKRPPKPW
jgi:NAD(P)-dependent dehydrogenase (short-subunit alcohol dehydrogenase family)